MQMHVNVCVNQKSVIFLLKIKDYFSSNKADETTSFLVKYLTFGLIYYSLTISQTKRLLGSYLIQVLWLIKAAHFYNSFTLYLFHQIKQCSVCVHTLGRVVQSICSRDTVHGKMSTSSGHIIYRYMYIHFMFFNTL